MWITVDVGLSDHPKMSALPSDTARYGWIVTLCRAKVQAKPGTFASDRHYKEVMGRFGKFLPQYLTARLLERNEDGSLAVHDWVRHQWSVRQAIHRDKDVTPALLERDISVTSALPTVTETRTETVTEKVTKAIAVAKPRASDPKKEPRNEPRLSAEQLHSWDSFGPAWSRFKEAWLGRGMLFAPLGSPDDDDTSARGVLFQIMDARPTDIVRWVVEAPVPVGYEVIRYIIEQWHEVRAEVGLDDEPAPDYAARLEARGALSRLGDLLPKPEPELAARFGKPS